MSAPNLEFNRTLKIVCRDFGQSVTGSVQSIFEFLEYAKTIEHQGFSRFWLGQHYGSSRLPNHELFLAKVLENTRHMQVGIAGTMISVHSPFQIASSYKLLSAFFPGRVDLGIATGRITAEESAEISGHCIGYDIEQGYDSKISQLVRYFENSIDKSDSPKPSLKVYPIDSTVPRVWMLGSGNTTLSIAKKFGLNYCLSLFHPNCNPSVGAELELFRSEFEKLHNRAPEIAIAVAGFCSDDELLIKNQIQCNFNPFIRPTIFGSADKCFEMFQDLAYKHRVSEVLFYNISSDISLKIQSNLSLSESFMLG